MTCGRRWIRTTEGINQQIYSLPHLATLVFARMKLHIARVSRCKITNKIWNSKIILDFFQFSKLGIRVIFQLQLICRFQQWYFSICRHPVSADPTEDYS